MPRTIAIGDIHGCSVALAALLDAIDPQPDDTIVTLGDYVDRGIDTKGVLDLLIALQGRCRLIPLLGNHEEMMLHARGSKSDFRFWMACGGVTALDSYGSNGRLSLIPDEHFAFLEELPLFVETDRHFLTHANYHPSLPLDAQDSQTLLWEPLDDTPSPHLSGKTAIVGHTPQESGEVLDLGHVVCIDTACVSGGLLTALELTSGKVWQVDERGRVK